MNLTPAVLDDHARRYYIAGDVPDVGIEELQQELSLQRISALVSGHPRVLEMGYGTGLTTRVLRARGIATEVIEGSPLLARTARDAHPGIVVHEALFEAFVPGRAYDAVLALHVLEHVDDPRTLLRRVRGWLRPGGRLVAAVPNAESLHRRLAVRMGLQPALDSPSERDALVGHRRVYTLAGLRADAEAAGLRVVDELGWFLKTLPNSMMLGFDPALLRAQFSISDELSPDLLANIAIVAEA